MPGLAGIISKQNSEISKQQLAVMLASMQHEKFYVSDTYEDQIMSGYAADAGFGAAQPVESPTQGRFIS